MVPNSYNRITVACVNITTFQITCTIINYAHVSRPLTNCRVIGSVHHKLVISGSAMFSELYLAVVVITEPVPRP